jgi:hypothetical protein
MLVLFVFAWLLVSKQLLRVQGCPVDLVLFFDLSNWGWTKKKPIGVQFFARAA